MSGQIKIVHCLYTGVHIQCMGVHKDGYCCSAKKSNYFIQIEYSTFRVQCWTLSFSNVLDSEKTANRSSEALYIKQLYCFH